VRKRRRTAIAHRPFWLHPRDLPVTPLSRAGTLVHCPAAAKPIG